MDMATLSDALAPPSANPVGILDSWRPYTFPVPTSAALSALTPSARKAVEAAIEVEAEFVQARADAYDAEASLPELRAADAIAGRVGDDREALKVEQSLDGLRAIRDAAEAKVAPAKRAAIEAVAADFEKIRTRAVKQHDEAVAAIEDTLALVAEKFAKLHEARVGLAYVEAVAGGYQPGPAGSARPSHVFVSGPVQPNGYPYEAESLLALVAESLPAKKSEQSDSEV